MAELFKAKVRRVGTSLGLLIPAAVASREGIREGQEVSATVLRERTEWVDELFGKKQTITQKERKKLIASSFGIDRGTKKFVRDRRDRF